ncbi:MAG: EpsI family protein [Capsulimonadales bacterium]|nr:EpsI family protein [Capsulimonadales bacterium]
MSNIRRSAYILGLTTAAIFGASLLWQPAPPPKFTGLDRAAVPIVLQDYRSEGDETVSEPVRAALSAADLLSRTYRSAGGRSVQFTLIAGTDRSALHDPRSCLVGAGWEIRDDHTEAIPGTGIRARVCRVVNTSLRQAHEMVYLYVADGRIVTEVTDIRLRMLMSALIGRKGAPITFVRFMRPLPAGAETSSADRARFLEFVAEMWNRLKLANAPAGDLS